MRCVPTIANEVKNLPERLVTGLAPGPWSPDPQGPRFLTMQLPSNSGPPPPFTLVLNWLPQLER